VLQQEIDRCRRRTALQQITTDAESGRTSIPLRMRNIDQGRGRDAGVRRRPCACGRGTAIVSQDECSAARRPHRMAARVRRRCGGGEPSTMGRGMMRWCKRTGATETARQRIVQSTNCPRTVPQRSLQPRALGRTHASSARSIVQRPPASKRRAHAALWHRRQQRDEDGLGAMAVILRRRAWTVKGSLVDHKREHGSARV
jgi:hypothetical protein